MQLAADQLSTLLDALAVRRPAFHSEADLQHELAWELRASGAASAVRLERPFETADGTINLDLAATTSAGRLAVELKYWKKRLDIHLSDEHFALKNQGAHDISRYDFWKDVWRLERLIGAGLADAGAAIVLTNDPGYWRQGRYGTIDAAFRLHEGRVASGRLAWAESAGAGTTRGRTSPIDLRGEYAVRWRDYSAPGPEVAFRSLVIPVSG